MSNDDSDEHIIEHSAAPLIEHLAELRTRLIYSVLAFVVAMLLCFSFARPLLFFLLEPTAKILLSYGQAPDFTTFAAQENFFCVFSNFSFNGFWAIFSDNSISAMAICCSWIVQE